MICGNAQTSSKWQTKDFDGEKAVIENDGKENSISSNNIS